jgi:hypothetical protein
VGAAARGAVYLISGLRGTFCGSAAVVGGSGDECGRFVVATTATYTVYRSDIGYTPSINRRSVLEAPLCLICAGVIDGQLLLEQFNNEQPLRYLPK